MPYKDEERNREATRNWQKRPENKPRSARWYSMPENKVRKREYQFKQRIMVPQHYSGSGIPFCACCGEANIEFLQVDHVDGGGTQHRKLIGKSALYRWLIQQGYPQGFRVLCANCNLSYGLYGYCPHLKARSESPLAAGNEQG